MPGLPHRDGPAEPSFVDGLWRNDPRRHDRKRTKLDVISAFQSYGEYLSGKIDENRRRDIVRHACPGAGACGGMYTANTMASAIEMLGMSLPYSSSTPAEDPLKLDECMRAGAAIRNLLELDLKPRDIMTREAFENAMVLITVLGGSTNAVLHLIAMARSVRVPLTIDDFQNVSDRVPLLADFKPSGYLRHGRPASGRRRSGVVKMLLAEGLINGDCMTVTGKTVRDNVKDLPGLASGSEDRTPLLRSAETNRPSSNPARAIWRRKAPSRRLPERKVYALRVRRRFTIPKKTCCMRWSGKKFRRAM